VALPEDLPEKLIFDVNYLGGQLEQENEILRRVTGGLSSADANSLLGRRTERVAPCHCGHRTPLARRSSAAIRSAQARTAAQSR
jgi:hypothetical protein